MGWSYTNFTTLKKTIQEQTAPYNGKNSPYEKDSPTYHEFICVQHCYRGSAFAGTLWKVMRKNLRKRSDDSIVESMLFIGCDLLRYDNTDNLHSWGVKEMDESCGPCEVNCPESYLEMVPLQDAGYAKDWRERVKEYHKNRRAKLAEKRNNAIHH